MIQSQTLEILPSLSDNSNNQLFPHDLTAVLLLLFFSPEPTACVDLDECMSIRCIVFTYKISHGPPVRQAGRESHSHYVYEEIVRE